MNLVIGGTKTVVDVDEVLFRLFTHTAWICVMSTFP